MLSDIIRIEELRSVEQGILDVFSNICDTNDLKYSLAYGTLLGAVRHHGFIPWDDDIDVMMPREDYDKLIEIWHSQAPKEYILDCQNTKRQHNIYSLRSREKKKLPQRYLYRCISRRSCCANIRCKENSVLILLTKSAV